tara:strand:- start:1465 stop:2664 length:1200 start_codon:yes stop_codon:yes gene_type:complete
MTYFKIATNIHRNINEKDIKLKLEKTPNIKKKCSYSLSNYLKETKKHIDNVYDRWDSTKIYTNPYEFIHTIVPTTNLSVSQYKPISRAFYKLIEIYNLFNITDYNNPINTFHLAEGPGGFLEATKYIRKNENDNYYGMTLINNNSSVPGWKKSKNLLNSIKNIHIEKGIDEKGDLFNEENFKYCCQKYRRKFEIITGDGGIDFSSNYNEQEKTASRLIVTQIFYALALQKKGGTFILKMFDIFNKASMDCLYILTLFYKKVFIVKPYTSRYANSEKYIVCMDFTDNVSKQIKYKFWSTLKILNNIDFEVYNIDSFLDINHNLHFTNSLEEINIILGQRQIENILFTIKIINNSDKYCKEKITKLKQSNISKCIKWCENNNIPTNKFKDILVPKNIFLNR